GGRGGAGGGGFGPASAPAALYADFKKPEDRMPRGYIIPANQPDFLTAEKFLIALQKVGIIVDRASAQFTVAGKTYPAGSFVVKTAQAYRPDVLDMFEPQDYPNDFPYPGAPPTRPYDNAGWTLALQMGVHFDRILDGFDGPFVKLDPLKDRISPTATTVATTGAGWTLSPKVNDSYHALARLWSAGADVYRLQRSATIGGKSYPAGTIYIPKSAKSTPVVDKSAKDIGVTFEASADLASSGEKLPPLRIGLWDRFGGSMPSGQMRWLMEQYQLPFRVVYPKELDEGNLRSKFDVLIFPENSIPGVGPARGGRGGGGGRGGQDTASLAPEYRAMLGNVSADRTLPKLKEFLNQGGRIIAIGPSSLNIAEQLGLPVSNHLVERTPTGTAGAPLPTEKYYVPGSLLEVTYDTTLDATRGEDAHGVVFFDNSPVMRLDPDAEMKGVKPIAWFENATPLRSGWAWGQNYLEGGVAMAEAKYGQGTVYLYGPEITFRAQPAATFKLLFNAIVGGSKVDNRIVP
ncbi:MAG: peptidase, partial [Gemmatimonadaceae bacterium]